MYFLSTFQAYSERSVNNDHRAVHYCRLLSDGLLWWEGSIQPPPRPVWQKRHDPEAGYIQGPEDHLTFPDISAGLMVLTLRHRVSRDFLGVPQVEGDLEAVRFCVLLLSCSNQFIGLDGETPHIHPIRQKAKAAVRSNRFQQRLVEVGSGAEHVRVLF